MADLEDKNNGCESELANVSLSTSEVSEGSAVAVCLSSSSFYNPVQVLNRDLSVAVLRRFVADLKDPQRLAEDDAAAPRSKRLRLDPETPIRMLEALAASGLRAIRYAKEVPGLASVLANDFSDTAVETITKNVASNDVVGVVVPNFGDAVSVLHDHRKRDKRFHAIDLDPYGCPSIFIDNAVQAVVDGGMLMVTCTDMAVLCGNAPETCHGKYGATSVRLKSCHEVALRILLQSIECTANKYSRYIIPLLSISVDFYIRVFVTVFTSQAKVKDSVCKLGYLVSCSGCDSFVVQPMALKENRGKGVKYSNAYMPNVSGICEHCGWRNQISGPVWTDPLHDLKFVHSLLNDLKTLVPGTPLATLSTVNRLVGLLTLISEELPDVPLYHVHDKLCSIVRVFAPKMRVFRSAILNAGYRVSLSHANALAIKTDAPNSLLWDILRQWALDNKVAIDKIAQDKPAFNILHKPTTHTVNFTLHADSEPKSRIAGLVRFPPNPEPHWGPGKHAKGSISSKSNAAYCSQIPTVRSDEKSESIT